MDRFTIYAGPAHKWGPWQEVDLGFGRAKYVNLEFGTIASAPSAGEVEIDYWDRSSRKNQHVVIPGKTYIKVGNCLCPIKMRAKSYSTGQAIEVTIDFWFNYAY